MGDTKVYRIRPIPILLHENVNFMDISNELKILIHLNMHRMHACWVFLILQNYFIASHRTDRLMVKAEFFSTYNHAKNIISVSFLCCFNSALFATLLLYFNGRYISGKN